MPYNTRLLIYVFRLFIVNRERANRKRNNLNGREKQGCQWPEVSGGRFVMAGSRDRTRLAILKALSVIGGSAGASRINQKLIEMGIMLQPRTVRFYLKRLDQDGFTKFVSRRRGRVLSEKGIEELTHANVLDKVGFVAAKVDSLSYRMSFDIRKVHGTIITNVGIVPRKELHGVLREVELVLARKICMGSRISMALEGETLGGTTIPVGCVGIGTVCSVTLNGIMLKEGIPITSRFGGIVEMRGGAPLRFVELIEYSGSTVDPVEVLINAGMTRVRECARSGSGLIGASFREVPTAALDSVMKTARLMESTGLSGIIAVGKPNAPLLDIPVTEGRTGVVVVAGLNPMAAVHEAGLKVAIQSLAGLEDYSRFCTIADILRK